MRRSRSWTATTRARERPAAHARLERAGAGGEPAANVGRAFGRRTARTAYFTYSSTACSTGLARTSTSASRDPVPRSARQVTADVGNKNYNTTYAAGRWELPAEQADSGGAAGRPGPDRAARGSRPRARGTARRARTVTTTPARASFGKVQRAFAGTDARSGPIRIAKVYDGGAAAVRPLPRSEGTHNLTVEIGLLGALAGRQAVDAPARRPARDGRKPEPVARLRSATCRSSRTSSPPAADRRTQINRAPPARPGQRRCGSSASAVAVRRRPDRRRRRPGLRRHEHARPRRREAHAPAPSPNNWTTDFPLFDAADPRIVQVFLTPYGSLRGQRQHDRSGHELRDFLRHRLDGNGGSTTRARANGDEIEGTGEAGLHLRPLHQVHPTLPSGGGTEKCDFDSFGACTMVLTE